MTEEKTLVLDGLIMNLTANPVVIVSGGGERWSTFCANHPLELLRVHNDVPAVERRAQDVIPHKDDCLAVRGATEKIGVLNDIFDLVRPLEDHLILRRFWERQVDEYCAQVKTLPMEFLDKMRKNNHAEVYGIVSRGVALVLHYCEWSVDNLLVPAMPVEPQKLNSKPLVGTLPDVPEVYQAFMPAKYLIE